MEAEAELVRRRAGLRRGHIGRGDGYGLGP